MCLIVVASILLLTAVVMFIVDSSAKHTCWSFGGQHAPPANSSRHGFIWMVGCWFVGSHRVVACPIPSRSSWIGLVLCGWCGCITHASRSSRMAFHSRLFDRLVHPSQSSQADPLMDSQLLPPTEVGIAHPGGCWCQGSHAVSMASHVCVCAPVKPTRTTTSYSRMCHKTPRKWCHVSLPRSHILL